MKKRKVGNKKILRNKKKKKKHIALKIKSF